MISYIKDKAASFLVWLLWCACLAACGGAYTCDTQPCSFCAQHPEARKDGPKAEQRKDEAEVVSCDSDPCAPSCPVGAAGAQ